MGLYNRDWDFEEEPQEQVVKVDKEEYLKMKENLERYRDLKETLIELIEESGRSTEQKYIDIKEEIDDFEEDE
jgi:hypothetical protein